MFIGDIRYVFISSKYIILMKRDVQEREGCLLRVQFAECEKMLRIVSKTNFEILRVYIHP